MAKSADETIDALLKAFPPVRPAGLPIVLPTGRRYPHDEYEDTENAFRSETDWTLIDPAFLDLGQNNAALAFMSDAAVRFYIPAYLTADLRGLLTCVEPQFTLTRGFDEEHSKSARENMAPLFEERGLLVPQTYSFTASARRCWAPLDPSQVDAITAYLEWLVVRDGPFRAEGAVEALATYWHPRAARA